MARCYQQPEAEALHHRLNALGFRTGKTIRLMRQAAFAYPESFAYFYSTLERFEQPQVRALLRDVEEARQFFGIERPH